MSDDDIRDVLRKAFGNEEEYPAEMKTATKAEYVTHIRKTKRPGCPFLIVSALLFFISITSIVLTIVR